MLWTVQVPATSAVAARGREWWTVLGLCSVNKERERERQRERERAIRMKSQPW